MYLRPVPPRKGLFEAAAIGARPAGGSMAMEHSVLSSPPRLEAWVTTLLGVAADHATGLRLEELLEMLPPGAPSNPQELRAWLGARPQMASVEQDWVCAAGTGLRPDAARRARSASYERYARSLLEGPLRRTMPWIRCLGISGSTAYGDPEEQDDLDLLVIAADGLLWLAMARLYCNVRRLRRPRGAAPGPRLCFNYARDVRTARREFHEARDPLFAREALSVRVLQGEAQYRELLAISPWMAERLPGLYARRREGLSAPPGTRPAPPSWAERAANFVAFLTLATYLQLAGLVRNRALRRAGRAAAVFRTRTALGALSYESVKFASIRGR